eukprot:TRINITY_DN8945_c0_g2_i1.p2 TRINITY_DN8945_c0_g2~~TRINITY_DN8945_c0_g2_i1.p2  ORF type:complete len:159 (+),score=44.33 TRINITY_DN8945_c0_g2_i1:71-478(+)
MMQPDSGLPEVARSPLRRELRQPPAPARPPAEAGRPCDGPQPAAQLPAPKFTPFEQHHAQRAAIRWIGGATAAGAALFGSATVVFAPAAVAAALPAAAACGAVGAAGYAAARGACHVASNCGLLRERADGGATER